jgi:hypothetical protein
MVTHLLVEGGLNERTSAQSPQAYSPSHKFSNRFGPQLEARALFRLLAQVSHKVRKE